MGSWSYRRSYRLFYSRGGYNNGIAGACKVLYRSMLREWLCIDTIGEGLPGTEVTLHIMGHNGSVDTEIYNMTAPT